MNDIKDIDWSSLSPEEKNRQLYLKQKNMLEMFLEHKGIFAAVQTV